MAATNALVIYSRRSHVIRRIIIPGNDSEIANPAAWHNLLHEGALVLTQLEVKHPKLAELVKTKLAALSLVPVVTTDPRCAVIDSNGKVVNIIAAEASIDSVAGYTLVDSPTAQIGDSYSNGVFTSPITYAFTLKMGGPLLVFDFGGTAT